MQGVGLASWRPSGPRELCVKLETERETPSAEAREAPRESPRSQSHDAVRNGDSVRVCGLDPHPRLVPKTFEFRDCEAFAAMTIRMVRRSRGPVVVQEF